MALRAGYIHDWRATHRPIAAPYRPIHKKMFSAIYIYADDAVYAIGERKDSGCILNLNWTTAVDYRLSGRKPERPVTNVGSLFSLTNFPRSKFVRDFQPNEVGIVHGIKDRPQGTNKLRGNFLICLPLFAKKSTLLNKRGTRPTSERIWPITPFTCKSVGRRERE